MKIDWKGMREALRRENAEIAKRREEKTSKLIKEREEKAHLGRASARRIGKAGQPASRRYAEKMAIPKGKQRK